VVKRYGADVLRLWVASTDFRNDMAASEKILKQVQEAYTKIRNTCRYLISNLYDYHSSSHPVVQPDSLLEVDKWILLRLNRLVERAAKAYDEFEFHLVYHGLYDFCVNDLSALYLDMSKDRLYCDGRDSLERRSAQTAMHEILHALIRLMAPILSFTAEDILRYIMSNDKCQMTNEGSIFLLNMAKAEKKYLDEKLEAKWGSVIEVREKVYQKLEFLRASKEIGGSIDAQVELFAIGKELEILKSIEALLPMVFIVSKVNLSEGEKDPLASHAPGAKCQRCWKWSESVGQDKIHSTLCDRCVKVTIGSGGVKQ
jgi:isoleucyl-tRNA synthetase